MRHAVRYVPVLGLTLVIAIVRMIVGAQATTAPLHPSSSSYRLTRRSRRLVKLRSRRRQAEASPATHEYAFIESAIP
jgi:hypothetical protein